ncbi:hypothetical protein CIL05_06150 [Virgibacillus profundi]|uniref:DUF1129 domain-containing protein n=1 Tax=Virgibacillus profundi TaxID=2024555 RepID=A0A2A2IHR8_9BACI|nr:DUF1129 family protein [Virgibacillus profundi]PAV30680.1 hypothetical protein CIL05_06150 [Virgibacillus profundi]PXY54852.1 DUF1129 domain-containing protein [Virgibacillus profundi]
MNAKEIIKLNNEKREQLNEANLAYYEDMLLYIRLSSARSEQYTEETLLELLEHLLQAQEEGRSAADVFGNNPKEYCQELIGEIPEETRKKQVRFSIYIILQFLAIISFVNGIVGFGMYYFFDLGSDMTTFSIGSGIAIVIIDLLILYLFITIIFRWLRGSAFPKKKQKKWVEFIQIWAFSTFSIGLFVFVIYIMPDFGATMSLPTISFAAIGVILYGLSKLINKKAKMV